MDKTMNMKAFFLFVILFLPVASSYAINIDSGHSSSWGYGQTGLSSAGDFIIAGSLGRGGQHGTRSDEWAIVSVIASKIVDHGGYFCPYQIQCNNKAWKKNVDTIYYWPSGFDYSKCAWLCEPGYSGQDCLPQEGTPTSCDATAYNTAAGGKFAGVGLNTVDGSPNKEWEITGFSSWEDSLEKECDVILGVVKFLNHGVIAAPVQVCCNRNDWHANKSYVDTVYTAGTQKVLCATGYEANAAGNDCVLIDKDICDIQNINFCSGFDKSSYDSSIHTMEEDPSGCTKYFCSEPGTAFPKAGDTSCVQCETGAKGGADSNNGVCVKCQTGEYFDQLSNTCKKAIVYSKTDLMYGKGKTKNAVDLSNQCWTLIDADDYINCVKGTATNTSASTGATSNTFVQAELPDTNTDSGLSINNINTAGNVIGTTMGVAGIMPAN